jgi:phage-related protein
MSEEFSIYFNQYAYDLLDKLIEYENKKFGYKLSKIQVIEKALEDRAVKIGLQKRKVKK